MIITQEQLVQLSRIYNTLMTVSTKGMDTLTMADCLRATETLINELSEQKPPVEIKTTTVTDEKKGK